MNHDVIEKKLTSMLSTISVDDKNPKLIKYSSEILHNGKKIEEMPPETFIQLARTQGNPMQTWSEVTDYGTDQKAIVNGILQKDLFALNEDNEKTKSLLKRMRANSANLVICYMGPELGFCICTQNPIEASAPVAIYTGAVKAIRESLDYAFRIPAKDNSDLGSSSNIFVDATQNGNISRFIQHAFDEKDMKEYEKNYGKINSDAARANLEAKRIISGGKIAIILFATRRIEKNEILLYNYGFRYWLIRNQRPQPFNCFGVPLPIITSNPIYQIKVMGNKLMEKGRELLADSKRASFMLSRKEILEQKETSIDDAKSNTLFLINHKPLEQMLCTHSNKLILFAQDVYDFQKHPRRKEYILTVLHHQTGIEWKWNQGQQIAYCQKNDNIYNKLIEKGFTVILETPTKGGLMGQKLMYLILKNPAHQDKLAEIDRLQSSTLSPDQGLNLN